MKRTPDCTITTFSGRHIDLMAPDPGLIHIDDIAASLTKVNRFGGHTHRPYTVAEHLLLGVEQCTPEARFRWFTHDFSEAYLGDVTGPLKRSLAMGAYRDLEAAWEAALEERFGIPARGAKEVRLVDARMLVTEQRDLLGRRPLSTDKVPPFALRIPGEAPAQAWLEHQFLQTFYGLVKTTEGARI